MHEEWLDDGWSGPPVRSRRCVPRMLPRPPARLPTFWVAVEVLALIALIVFFRSTDRDSGEVLRTSFVSAIAAPACEARSCCPALSSGRSFTRRQLVDAAPDGLEVGAPGPVSPLSRVSITSRTNDQPNRSPTQLMGARAARSLDMRTVSSAPPRAPRHGFREGPALNSVGQQSWNVSRRAGPDLRRCRTQD